MFPHLKYSEADVDGYISGATPEMVAASLGKAQATELFVKSVLAAQIRFWMQSGIAHGDVMFRVGDVQIPPGGVWTPSSPMGAVFRWRRLPTGASVGAKNAAASASTRS